jgi:ferrous iron transport protein A
MSNCVPLPNLKIGAKAVIARIETTDEGIIRHLMALGVLQGVRVVLERRFPSYVVMVGRSRIALDENTAKTIYVSQDF